MRLLWRDGHLAEVDAPALRADDPAVRGLGLVETMLAQGGAAPWLDRHVARMSASAEALGLRPFPDARAIERAVGEVLDAGGSARLRVRVTASAQPSLVVEASPASDSDASLGVHAVSARSAWHPERRLAEHKTTSHGDYLLAQRAAERAGADHALLLDAEGRLGEAALGNAFCVIEGRILTSPARGLLPGIARAEVMRLRPVEQRAAEEAEWRAATELFVTNAVRGIVPVVSVDGHAIGEGTTGPVARELAGELAISG